MDIAVLLLIQALLIALNAIFACAEIAVLSVSEAKLSKLAEEGDKKARRLLKLTDQPAKFLATIQVAITLSGFLGSALAADNFAEPLTAWLIGLGLHIPAATLNTLCVVVITLILSFVTLVLGELVPKRIAMQKAEEIALGISGLVSFIAKVFRPVVWLLSVTTNGVLRLFGIDPNAEEEEASEEEILLMVDAGSEKGTIDEEERDLIQNIFEFDDTTAGEIITHRTDVTILWLEDSDEDWEKTIFDSRFTRFPVCQDSPDNIVGILNSKEYLRLTDKSRQSVMKNAVRPAYFVPESIKADVLFRNMKKERNPLAVVLDEYGGMVGIVTLSDLVEELVGDLVDDDFEEETAEGIEQLNENTWRLTGNMTLKDMEEDAGIDFENEEFETFTGLVFNALDAIPTDGKQSIDLEIGNYKIHISYMKDHQVERAIIKRKPEETPEEEK